MTFVRRFNFDPGNEVITQIEGMVLISRQPPGSTIGAQSGIVLCVGEFEDGDYEVPTEVEGGGDLQTTFGGFGYTVGGVVSCNPSARGRKADNATSFEYWNGNGFISLVNKLWGGLIVCRVDTSVGAVEFTRLPAVTGNSENTWVLEAGQNIVLDLFGTQSTVTFDAAVADLLSADGVYPTTFAGGEKMNVTIDQGTPQQIGPIDIVFTSGDQTHTAVVNRINAVLGYTAASAATLKTHLVGRNKGTAGKVKINSIDSLVATATGFSATSASGTGDVSNIGAVTFLEAKTRIEADASGTRVDRDNSGNIRIAATSADTIMVVSQTATAFGFTDNLVSTEPDGFAVLVSGAGTYPDGFTGGETLTLGFDGDPDATVTFQAGDTTRAAVIARVNTAVGYEALSAHTVSTKLVMTGRENGGQVRVVAASAGVLTALGLSVVTVNAVAHDVETIPAGTRVQDDTGVEWVTTQTQQVQLDDSGPYSCRIRPANDDGTNAGASADELTVLPTSPGTSAWSVNNPDDVSAALTESQIDAQYQRAFDATLSQTSVAKTANLIFSARQSNAVRSMGRLNVVKANSSGMAGRIFMESPPLGTTRARAKSSGVAPGVGVTRNKDVVYCYPGVNTFVPQIAARGLAGGAGFTADGNLDVHFDAWVASTCSQLPPEQNPGQQTDFMVAVRSVEVGNVDVQNLSIEDYIAFKAAGIAAPIIDDGVCLIQSAVTSVNPSNEPGYVDISQRRFEYFIQDSLIKLTKRFSKKSQSRQAQSDFLGTIDQFLLGLKSPGNPAAQRIVDYSIDARNPNTKASLGAGIFRTVVKVQMIPDFKYIVFETEVGPNVDVSVVARAA